MRLLRFAGMTALALTMAALTFFPGPPASGQSAPEVPGANHYPAKVSTEFTPLYQLVGQDPEMQKLLGEEGKAEREAAGLAKEYARVENESERAKIKTKLADVLGKQFDAQQKRRDAELARLEAQVKKLREVMKKRTDARSAIVGNRLDQLTREAEGLGWTAPPGLVPRANFIETTLPQLPQRR